MKMGRMKKDGWVKKVLNIFECQVEMRAVTRPGEKTVTSGMRKRRMPVFCANIKTNEMKKRDNFPVRVKREAKKRRRNLLERSLSPGKTLHGPVLRALARPMLAVKMDDASVT